MSNEAVKTTAPDGWGLLRAGAQRGDVRVSSGLEIPTIPSGVTAAAGPVRFAIGQGGEPRVLLPLAEGEAMSAINGGLALSVSVSSFSHDGRILRFLDLVCRSADLETVFGEVVDEMLARIDGGNGCVDAARSTIEDFRSLLQRGGSLEVDKRIIAGLVAELVVLNRLLERSSSAWKAWCGPAGNRHDFRTGDTSLEVKASLRPDTRTITINGLEQLEVPTEGTLHLFRIVLESVNGGAQCVSNLAHRAMSLASEPEKILDLIAAAGCNDVDAKQWNGHSFRIESEHLYDIRPGFPRLVMSMLISGVVPHGVRGVTYQVDLSAADSFLCQGSVMAELEEKLCP